MKHYKLTFPPKLQYLPLFNELYLLSFQNSSYIKTTQTETKIFERQKILIFIIIKLLLFFVNKLHNVTFSKILYRKYLYNEYLQRHLNTKIAFLENYFINI